MDSKLLYCISYYSSISTLKREINLSGFGYSCLLTGKLLFEMSTLQIVAKHYNPCLAISVRTYIHISAAENNACWSKSNTGVAA